jgi:hypothetical protein
MSPEKFPPLPNGQVESVCLVLGVILREERLRRGWKQSNFCISGMRLPWLNAMRVCIRPKH